MKSLTTFIFCLIFQTTFFAQDMLVKSTGEKIVCKIIDVDSSIVSFQSEDTTKKEISIVQKQDVLAMQRNNEKTIFFFIPDTLFNSNGNKISCKVIAIDPGTITYIPVDSTMGDLTIAPNNLFSMIHFGNGREETIENKSESSDAEMKSSIDDYKMGQDDAAKYFKTGGIVAGEVVSGVATYILGIGVISGVVIYAFPPKKFYNIKNPNNNLLDTNKDYYAGYRAAAIRIQHKKAALGYAAGLLAPVSIVLVSVYTLQAQY